MSVFKTFEMHAIHLMAKGILSDELLRSVFESSRLKSYDHTGAGYFLRVEHPDLSSEEMTLSEPAVVGNAGDIQAGFVLFLGDRELTLECHTWGPVDVPVDFRDREVTIGTPPVNVVDLR